MSDELDCVRAAKHRALSDLSQTALRLVAVRQEWARHGYGSEPISFVMACYREQEKDVDELAAREQEIIDALRVHSEPCPLQS